MVRGRDGQVRAFSNVCRHRGSLLCEGDGNVDKIRCPNHAWTYSLEGRLVKAAYVDTEADAVKGGGNLLPVHAGEFAGTIFLNLSDDARPLADSLGDVPKQLQDYGVQNLTLMRETTLNAECNWKILVENLTEAYHTSTVHPGLAQTWLDDGFHVGPASPPWMRWWYEHPGAADGKTSPTLSILRGSNPRPVIPNIDDECGRSVRFFRLFPNISFVCSPDYVVTLIILPDGPENATLLQSFLFPFPTMDGFDASDAYDSWDSILAEDVAAIRLLQRGLHSKRFSTARITVPHEQSVAQFQSMVRAKVDPHDCLP
jgi:Rieske 2Fe-2S family protein